jgi:hypothetical protein
MKFIIIRGVTYEILCDKLPFPFTHSFGNGSEEPIIASKGDVVCLISKNDMDIHNPYIITSLNELTNYISEISENKWLLDHKEVYMKPYTKLVNLMTVYQREITIDSVLRKEIDYRYYFC